MPLLPPELRYLDDFIAAGWGDIEQECIPSDWRTRPGPDRSFDSAFKARVTAGLKHKWRYRNRAPRGSQKRLRMERWAGEMRLKYGRRRA